MAEVYLSFNEKVEIFPVCFSFMETEEIIKGKHFIIRGKNQLIGVFYPERARCDSPWECVPSAFYNYLWNIEVMTGSMEDIVEWLMIHEPTWNSIPKIKVLEKPLSPIEAKKLEQRRKRNLQRRIRFLKKMKKEKPDYLFLPLRLTDLALSTRNYLSVIHGGHMKEFLITYATVCGIANLSEALAVNGFESDKEELLNLKGIKNVCFTLDFREQIEVPFLKNEVKEMFEEFKLKEWSNAL